MYLIGLKVTTCLKKLKLASPIGVWGNKVTEVGRGQEIMETRRIPIMIAPRTRYIIMRAVKKPPRKTPNQIVGFWRT
jgi:hypothetical protein